MSLIWKCSICGEEANYKSGGKCYCEKHWDVFLGFKTKEKSYVPYQTETMFCLLSKFDRKRNIRASV